MYNNWSMCIYRKLQRQSTLQTSSCIGDTHKIVNRCHQGSEVWRLSHMVHYTYTVLAKIRSPKEMFLNHFLSEKEALRHYGKF